MENLIDNSISTRHSLLNRLKDWRDESSWCQFFDRYWQLIHNFSRKAGLSDAEAQEVVQETIISVAKNIEKFKAEPERGSFKAWLLQQARWRIARQFEKRKGGAKLLENLLASGPEKERSPEIEALWENEWQTHITRRALEQVKAEVSQSQFQMFDLHALQGLSVLETARALGVSMASIYMAKSRVARIFRRKLEQIVAEAK